MARRSSALQCSSISSTGGGSLPGSSRSRFRVCNWAELKILRAIKQLNVETPLNYVPTFLGAHDLPFEYKSRRQMYVDLIVKEMLPRVAEERLAEYCDVFCEEGVFTTDESWQILSAARCHGLGLRVHADQLSLSGGASFPANGSITSSPSFSAAISRP